MQIPKAFYFFFPFFVAFTASGLSSSSDSDCKEPLWNVVGSHYAPRGICGLNFRSLFNKINLRDKYFKAFMEGQANLYKKKVNEILDEIMMLAPPHDAKSFASNMMCIGCSGGINTYRFLQFMNYTRGEILSFINNLCTDLNIMSPVVCKGMLDLYGNVLAAIVEESNVTADHICTVLLNLKCGNGNIPELNWEITLPNTKKPPVVKPIPLPDAVKSLKVLHLTDTHWDVKYEPGSWAECNLPLCCRKENVPPDEKASRAGKYGGWKCDASEAIFDDVLEHIAEQHPDIDYIIWTGDIPAHDIWAQTRAENLDVLKKTVSKIFATFPNVPLFSALGNHETVPSNMFPEPSNVDENPMEWLYNEVSTQWRKWLPENITQTVRMGGFYTTLIRPGLRVVSMNMNYCYNANWWLIKNKKDPLNELQWFVDILQEAENKNESVHVIGHVPAGSSDCLEVWQRNFYKIINRYEKTVTAQFYGHTHTDEYELFYDMENTSRPVAVGYIAPSLTTYTYLNPRYRIYYVEGDDKESRRYVKETETWFLDLEKANRENKTDWKILYRATSSYNMTSLYPEDWHKFYERMLKSDELLQLYDKHYWGDSPKRNICNDSCRKSRLCGIRSCDRYGFP